MSRKIDAVGAHIPRFRALVLFLDAGRLSAWMVASSRRPKTFTLDQRTGT